MRRSDGSPLCENEPERAGKFLEDGLVRLLLFGVIYLLGVLGLRAFEAALCSTGGCYGPPFGSGWENQAVAVSVVCTTVALQVVAHYRGSGLGAHQGLVLWAAGAVVLFAKPFL